MKILKGKVISIFMKSTIIVQTLKVIKHFKYNKITNKFKKYYVHDQYNLSCLNDIVEFFYLKPFSKKKFWIIFRIL